MIRPLPYDVRCRWPKCEVELLHVAPRTLAGCFAFIKYNAPVDVYIIKPRFLFAFDNSPAVADDPTLTDGETANTPSNVRARKKNERKEETRRPRQPSKGKGRANQKQKKTKKVNT